MVGSAGPLFGLAFLIPSFYHLKKIKLKHIKIDEYYIEILSIILFLVILIFPYQFSTDLFHLFGSYLYY